MTPTSQPPLGKSQPICLFTHGLSGGGAERVTALLANAFAERGLPVVVITVAPIHAEDQSLHPAVRRLAMAADGAGSALGSVARVIRLHLLLRCYRPRVVIAMMMVNGLLARLAATTTGIPIISCERNHPLHSPLPKPWSWLRPILLPRCRLVVAQTTGCATLLRRLIPGLRPLVIPNPVVIPPRHADAAPQPRILMIGRLSTQKNMGDGLAAAIALLDRYPQWHLDLVGSGALRDALEQQGHAANGRERIHFHPYTRDINTYYQRASILLLSSRYEGFPNVLLEAMAHGLPCISYDCEFGPRDIIRDGENGFLVDPQAGVAGLQQALERALSDESWRQRAAAQALRTATRFAVAEIISQWRCLLRKIGIAV